MLEFIYTRKKPKTESVELIHSYFSDPTGEGKYVTEALLICAFSTEQKLNSNQLECLLQ